jgi:alkylhydroperoxidase family enzyme
MARVSYIEPQNASPEVKAIYDEVFKGKPNNVPKAMAHRPEILKVFPQFYGAIGKGMDKRLYELVYIRVSMVNQCQY